MAKKSYEQYLEGEPEPSLEDIAIADSMLAWLETSATGSPESIQHAKNAMNQLKRYAQNGKVDEWKERKGELARMALIDAGFIDLVQPEDVLTGEALALVGKKVFEGMIRS